MSLHAAVEKMKQSFLANIGTRVHLFTVEMLHLSIGSGKRILK